MTDSEKQATQSRLGTGVPGLDKILHGGFIAGRSYFVSGGAGAGKTTLGLHFLAQAAPEDALLVSLSETHANIRADARTIGLNIDDTYCIDISPTAQTAGVRGSYTLLEPWDAEPPDLLTRISDTFKEKLPARIFIDALSQYRHLFADAYQFRRQVLELLEYLGRRGATVLISSEAGSAADEDLQYLGDGMLRLAATPIGRTLTVTKFRASGFAEGEHTVRLTDRGMRVFECLVPAEHHRDFTAERLSSGVAEIDVLTGGGLDRGTVTLLSGPSGVGKTTLGTYFMREAAARGERSVIFSFEERTGTLCFRCQSIGIPLDDMLAQGTLSVREIEPLRYAPDEFASEVRREVEEEGAQIVMIDSLAGYRQSVKGGSIARHVHALCRYLGNMGVTVLLINEMGTIVGDEVKVSEHGISYLADTVVLMRYIERDGAMSKTIGTLKKRTGDFDKVVRKFQISEDGLRIGAPLSRPDPTAPPNADVRYGRG